MRVNLTREVAGRFVLEVAPDGVPSSTQPNPTITNNRESPLAYANTQLFIGGKWRPAQSGKVIEVVNPATEEVIGTVAHAEKADLDEALAAAAAGFKVWRNVAPFERCRIMRKAAAIMRERNDEIAPLLTMEQGKTLGEAKMEAMAAADSLRTT